MRFKRYTVFSCGKIGHFSRVCRSKKKIKTSASTYDPIVSSIFAGFPKCLKTSVVEGTVNGISDQILMDTGFSESYIDHRLLKGLKLSLKGEPSAIIMASISHSAQVKEAVVVNLKVFNNNYPKFKLGVMQELCADVILGIDFMKLHSEIEFKMHGPQEAISVNSPLNKPCNVRAAEIEPPKIFRFISPDCVPVATKCRRYSESDKKFIKEEISRLLEEGVIEPSHFSWRSQVLITKDENHKKRMVNDYSQIVNHFTHLDAYPLPRIDELIYEIAKSKYVLQYCQFKIRVLSRSIGNRKFTAFEANGKLYQYCRMPFRVNNGVSTFQRMIDNLIEKYKLMKTCAYLDNVTVTGRDKDKHNQNLKALLNAASCEGFTLNEKKFVYSATELDLLGYKVSHNTIMPDPGRLQPLINLPVPSTKKELKRCLGTFAYYARWLKNFSTKIAPLTGIKTFPLTNKAVSAFET